MESMNIFTDRDVKFHVFSAISELEVDEIITFIDVKSKEEFTEFCVSEILEKFYLYDQSPVPYHPDYLEEVLAIADGCEYCEVIS